MAGYAKLTVIGNVGNDVEMREYEGQKVANFSIAVNQKVKNQELTSWYRIALWGNRAEVAEKYVKKGDMVYIEGSLSVRQYTDNSGASRLSMEVNGQNIQLLGGKREEQPPY